jgi:hypothetical protein
MNASGIIVRFLSLLDVALILVGVLMLALIQTTVDTAPPLPKPDDDTTVLGNCNFIVMKAGWKDDERGKCYLLDKEMKIKREVSIFTKMEFEVILGKHELNSQRTNVVLLLFDADGWYTSWESPPHYDLAETWDVQVVRVDEFTFSH